MMTLVFWWSVALVFYAYAGYPLALMVLTLFRNRVVTRELSTPAVTFTVAAYNEERRLREKIDNTLRQIYPGQLEIIVASDGSTDGTDDIARAFGDRVRLVRAPERKGKEAAQKLAVEAA